MVPHDISLIFFPKNNFFVFQTKKKSATTVVATNNNVTSRSLVEAVKQRSQTELRQRRNAWLGDRDSTGRGSGRQRDVQVLGSAMSAAAAAAAAAGSGPFLRGVADPGHQGGGGGRSGDQQRTGPPSFPNSTNLLCFAQFFFPRKKRSCFCAIFVLRDLTRGIPTLKLMTLTGHTL